MILGALMAAVFTLPGGQFGRAVWTDYYPVTPGKSYKYSMRKSLSYKNSSIWVYPMFYDEDKWLLDSGSTDENLAQELRILGQCATDKLTTKILTPTAKTRFVRLLITATWTDAIEEFKFEEAGTTDVRPETRRFAPSPWCIVVPERESVPIDLASHELQHWMKEIGSERPEVVRGKPLAGKSAIFLGRDFLKKDTGANDSWIITKKGRNIYLTANLDEGVINAVFDLLERNTDIIFARTDEIHGTVFTKTNGIQFRDCESHEVPRFAFRQFGLTGTHIHYPTQIWMRRNYFNRCGTSSSPRDIGKLGAWFTRKELHYEYGELIPNARFFDTHPEFYGMKEGKRRPYEDFGVQPCHTSKDGHHAMAETLRENLRKNLVPGVSAVDLAFGDTWTLCTCPDCVKPITLPSGRVLAPTDKEFRSYQYYKMMSDVVGEVASEFPDLVFETIAYIYTAPPPPETTIPKNIKVTFCPYPKSCRDPVYNDQWNGQWHERCEGWAKCGADLGIYEYYGNAFAFARPAGEVAKLDMLYWLKLGFSYRMYSEMPPDVIIPSQPDEYAAGWDFGMMENWVLSRLFVNPDRDVFKLRDEFCERAFHEAAPQMKRVFRIIRDEWFADRKHQYWSEDPVDSIIRYVRDVGHEDEMRGLLEQGEAAAKHPNSKALIHRMRERFENLLVKADKKKPKMWIVPLKGKTLEVELTGGRCKTWHDGQNLFVAFDINGPIRYDPRKTQEERFPFGSGAGVLIRPTEKDSNRYYHFLVTPKGRKYDARGYDYHWNSEGFTATVKLTKSGWRGLLSIPLKDVGIDPATTEKAFLRFVSDPLQPRSHDTLSYRPYKFE